MELEEMVDGDLMQQFSSLGPIDPGKARFPCCIVWTPLPVISWLVPFIGHIGICREDGVILDFAGPNFVCVDNFAFGAVARYLPINREKCRISPNPSIEAPIHGIYDQSPSVKEMTWDEAIRKSTQEFQHRAYSLFTCNCHSFVANNLNRVLYHGDGKWNVVTLAILIFFNGSWVNRTAIIRSYLPFVIVVSLGLLLGGSTFLMAWAAFSFALVGWFLIGTYCFKNLIEL